MTELWKFEDFLFIHIFNNFYKLKIYYEFILSKIYKNGLQTHPPPWLRNTKIHIVDTSPWLRDNKIMEPTHDSGAIGCAFSPEHAGIQIVTLRRKMAELWRYEDF